jgi:hypothetical protein
MERKIKWNQYTYSTYHDNTQHNNMHTIYLHTHKYNKYIDPHEKQ